MSNRRDESLRRLVDEGGPEVSRFNSATMKWMLGTKCCSGNIAEAMKMIAIVGNGS